MTFKRLFAGGAAVCILGAAMASACDSTPGSVSPTAQIPTFIEHLDASGTIVKLTAAEGWDGTYPIRIVQQDEFGDVVAEQVLTRPPEFILEDEIRQMTPAQRDNMEMALESLAQKMPGSAAGAALDEVRKIRSKQGDR